MLTICDLRAAIRAAAPDPPVDSLDGLADACDAFRSEGALASPFRAAALGFALLVFVVATHKPFVSPRERRRRMLVTFIPVVVVGFALLFGRRRQR